MFKRIAICCLVFIFCCTSAHAVNNCIHLDVSIHYPGGNTSRSADLYFTEEKMLVVSDLFPSSYLSVPFPEGNARSEISFSIPEFSVFSETDLRPVLSAWSMGLHNENTSGFYSGYLFDTATDLTEGTCGTKDFILLLVNAISAITGKSTAADELPEGLQNS